MHVVLRLFARMEERGYSLVLLEGYRSPDRQDRLANLGAQVTNARALQSRHQFGLAADIAPLRDGRLVISERDPWAFEVYQALGQEAEALGLIWGGRWKLRDYGHVEVVPAKRTVEGANRG
jgi:peptidoglycan L-alanyl-D-glutamate endopeptidase CwlK